MLYVSNASNESDIIPGRRILLYPSFKILSVYLLIVNPDWQSKRVCQISLAQNLQDGGGSVPSQAWVRTTSIGYVHMPAQSRVVLGVLR